MLAPNLKLTPPPRPPPHPVAPLLRPRGRAASGSLLVAHSKQVVEYPNDFRPRAKPGIYRGEALGAGLSMHRHGRGVMDYSDGDRYEGEWWKDKRSGRGVCSFRNGDRYEGEFDWGFCGRWVYLYADGRRLYDGAWDRGDPMGGAVLEGDGAVWRTACGGWYVSSWDIGQEGWSVSASWTRTGVTVTAGRPPAEAPGSGEWAGAWTREGGEQVEGRLRGLRPVAGVETDGDGRRWRLTYDGERTLAERLLVTSRTVRTVRTGIIRKGRGGAIASGSWEMIFRFGNLILSVG